MTDFNLMHLLNANPPMLMTVSGTVKSHFMEAMYDIMCIMSKTTPSITAKCWFRSAIRWIFCHLHPVNGLAPIDVIPSGIRTLVKALHSQNALFSIDAISYGRTTVFNKELLQNALLPF